MTGGAPTEVEDHARDALLDFWSRSQADWFSHDAGFDLVFRSRFLTLFEQARAGGLQHWEESPEGCLGLLILLDQFPRNAFRGSARMYATDDVARRIARTAMNKGFIGRVPTALQLFMILPFAHSENVDDQELSLSLHKAFEPEGADRARRHWRIVKRFGRFPHRNGILGRTMTVEERRYLENGGFSG